MIKKISIKGLRGIDSQFNLKETNIFAGKNASGKSSIISVIKDIFKGKTNIKEGDIIIELDDGQLLVSKNGKLFESISLGTKMDLYMPGFLMNGTPITGVNKTTEDRRKTISDLLGIDRDGFFNEAGVTYDIKGLIAELKEMKVKESTYGEELISLEKEIKEFVVIEKPTDIKLTSGNENELTNKKSQLESLKSQIRTKKELKDIGTEVKLTSGNENDLNILKKELEVLGEKGKSIQDTCPTCLQKISNAELIKEKIRNDYIEKAKEIKKFVLIKGNQEEYSKYVQQKSEYDSIVSYNSEVDSFNKSINDKIIILEKEIKDFKVVKGNSEEYEKYNSSLIEYNTYINRLQNNKDREKELLEKIKTLNSKSIEDKIKKYKDTEKEFVKFVENKLTVGDLKIIFYEELQTPNTDGDLLKPTFNIEYKGKMYDECSGGERGVIDILIANMFIRSEGLIDFILIDNAEISNNNIQSLIENELIGLQVIATRISNINLTLVHSLK